MNLVLGSLIGVLLSLALFFAGATVGYLAAMKNVQEIGSRAACQVPAAYFARCHEEASE